MGQSLTAGSGGSSERCSGSGPAPYSQEPSGTESDSRLWRLIRKVFRQWASSIQPGTKWDRVRQQALEAHQKGVQAVGQLHTARNQVGQSLTAGSGGSSERCSGSGTAMNQVGQSQTAPFVTEDSNDRLTADSQFPFA